MWYPELHRPERDLKRSIHSTEDHVLLRMTDSLRDTFVIIAAYRESSQIGRTVAMVAARYPNVIVVDDGSDDDTAGAARAAGATVLRHAINRGQGAALQTGIRYALARGAEYIVSFDADGQHRVEDVAKLLEPLVAGACEVTLGSRFLGDNAIPRVRRWVLKAGVLFTRLVSGIRVTDTHNGLRGFTRRAAAAIDIRLDGMAHASEILDQIAGKRLRFVEVPVQIRYTTYSVSKGQRSTAAIRIVWDFFMGWWSR